MKEVLTKEFWKGVKKTFYEAMEEQPAKEHPAQSSAGENAPEPASDAKPSGPADSPPQSGSKPAE